ncbi:hypothetical protein JX265_011198 [Neoarthrinium moseri]|uniref:Phospholipase A2 n=1 Tax=Neoarthrinium moseri TaxID=1658444 RepID=A0A9P9WCL2_9PEZI|nr:uncharacterized protein JN550_010502 [Neoarthrinium moseri]KAI1845906.1 hypothetical protein JX266_007993 [Neoarthrinium moseri]KAI1857463.1 hypothetical protein JX265_011198 [Neoarthrinium moseri]KAI1862037.1 hypothetical protein JN550_010502 [Neoarthrinium moseri]
MHFTTLLPLLTLSFGASVVAPAPVTDDGGASCDVKCQVDRWLFHTPISEFYAQMQKVWWNPPSSWNGIDWVHNSKYVQDDQCSVPQKYIDQFNINDKNKPRGYNFLQSCYRHDFGYANYRKEGRFTEDNRGKIDGNFHDDMKDVCNKEGNIIKKTECLAIAEVYYRAVRLGGGK